MGADDGIGMGENEGLPEQVESKSLVLVLALASALVLVLVLVPMEVLMLFGQDDLGTGDEMGYELEGPVAGRTR
jgi:hypothetical protein